MATRRSPTIKDQRVAIAGGIAGMIFAAWCFRDAWERRGQHRPAVASWLGV